MEKLEIKRFVYKDQFGNMSQVHFQHYRQGYFYYAVQDFITSDMYEFPVPADDIGTATLLRTDKAITFMRWIRKSMQDGTFIKQ